MPPVVAAVGWALAGAAATSATAIAVGYFLIGAATVIGYGILLVAYTARQQRAKKQARDKYNASQVDRLQSLSSTTGPRELVLGRVRKGGAVVFRDSCGSHQEKFVLVLALASHKISGVEKYYFNEKEVEVDNFGKVLTEPYGKAVVGTERFSYEPKYTINPFQEPVLVPCTEANYPKPATPNLVDGSLVGPYYSSRSIGVGDNYGTYVVAEYTWQTRVASSSASIRIVDGSQTAADARLQTLFPGVWTENHKLLGVAYAIIELDYNESAYPSGIPNFTAVIRGAEVYDPRTGTTGFSTNPALHARHIVTHPRFGKRTSLTAREDARIIAAANACDTEYTPITNLPGFKTQLYQSNCVFPYGGQASDALDDICEGMCGMWAYAGGEFFIKAGVYTAPVKTLQAYDFLTTQKDSNGGSTTNSISINTHRARADKINSVTAKIYDLGADYKETTITPVKNTEAIEKDGMELPLEISLPTVSTSSQAKVVCNYLLKDSFDPLALSATFKLSAYPLELFDNVAITASRYGWNSKVFAVLGRTFTQTGGIELTLKETSAELYNPEIYANSQGFASNTGLREPWDIDHPGVLTMSSGTSELLVQGDGAITTRVRVQWTEILDERIRQGGHVEVRWRDLARDTWSTVTVPGVESSAYLLGAVDGSTIVVMARTRTQLAVSDWNIQKTHSVLGKSEPPKDVTGLSVTQQGQELVMSYNKGTDLDLAGYEVRTSNTGWGEAGEVYRGSATTFKVKPEAPTTVWYVKSFDRTGNYAVNATQVSYTVPAVSEVSNIDHVFADTSLTAATITLSWKDAQTTFGYDYYELAYNGTSITVKANTITVPANWIGNRNFVIKTVDKFGFKSSGVTYPVTKLAPAKAVNFRAQVVDNNVLLYWKLPEKTSLPIAHARIRKGEAWATAEEIGTKDGEFTTIFELAGGEFRYWLAIVDTDGYESEPVNLTAAVTQPPDFLFLGEQFSTFDGTKVNAREDAGSLILPVNLTETFAQHFTSAGWAGPSAQIAAGYPVYAQPGVSSGSYEEIFDFGTVVASSSVSVVAAGQDVAGSTTRLVTVSLSDDLVDWTVYVGYTQLFATNFRYVKVKLEVSQTVTGGIYKVEQLSVRLDTKTLTDGGTVTALASDASGTVVNLNTEFLDVGPITLAVNSAASRQANYVFRDYTVSGTYSVVANVATLSFTQDHGLVSGQNVRISPTSGTLARGVYQVLSVLSAQSYTVAVDNANTSGGCSAYANSFTVYVYDNSGDRQSNVVSWNLRGS